MSLLLTIANLSNQSKDIGTMIINWLVIPYYYKLTNHTFLYILLINWHTLFL